MNQLLERATDVAARFQRAVTENQTGRQAERTSSVNVAPIERFASLGAGGALVGYALRTDSWWKGLLAALAGSNLLYRGATGHCGLYSRLDISTARQPGPATSVPASQGYRVEQVITINKPAAELFRAWRDLENLPKWMDHLESVRVLAHRPSAGAGVGGGVSHWIAKGPVGMRAEWDAEIINERENELLAWRSLPGSEVDNAGSVHFKPAPGGRGTEVRVELKYDPPAGKTGAILSKLLGSDPRQQVREDLRRFKQLMETGEVATA